MKLVIRISGKVELSKEAEETLTRMRLRRKYTAVLLPSAPSTDMLLNSVRNFVAYGDLSSDALLELLQKRALSIDRKKKIDAAKAAEQLAASSKSRLEDFNMKPFFRLHPPRGGIDSKLHFGKRGGVLGDNGKNINELVRRML